MARTFSPRRSRDVTTGVKPSEVVIYILVVLGIIAAVRWYINYRHSAPYALSAFYGAIKASKAHDQYALLDPSIQAQYATEKEYDQQCPLAHGYADRIQNVNLGDPKYDNLQNPTIAEITAHVTVRSPSQGEQLYQTGTSTYIDKDVLKKDAAGDWKVVLGKCQLGMTASPANPTGMN
ncbi:MAG: hypothetical protein KGJ62_13380 [Armatimonadetes bacterium]|nr:hypothetical protein [Armatimonadota bacterium]MDE2206846.1 hypothetical protein [Armatimonadota bacterium]